MKLNSFAYLFLLSASVAYARPVEAVTDAAPTYAYDYWTWTNFDSYVNNWKRSLTGKSNKI
jgi:hypothetical protein